MILALTVYREQELVLAEPSPHLFLLQCLWQIKRQCSANGADHFAHLPLDLVAAHLDLLDVEIAGVEDDFVHIAHCGEVENSMTVESLALPVDGPFQVGVGDLDFGVVGLSGFIDILWRGEGSGEFKLRHDGLAGEMKVGLKGVNDDNVVRLTDHAVRDAGRFGSAISAILDPGHTHLAVIPVDVTSKSSESHEI